MSENENSEPSQPAEKSAVPGSLSDNALPQQTMNEAFKTMTQNPGIVAPKMAPERLALAQRLKMATPEELNQYQSAGVFMQSLAEEAMAWQKQLPENYRPAIIAILQGGVQIQVNSLSQVSFHGIRIEGTLNGSPCSLLAHQSTVQMLCFGQEQTEQIKSNPIGFIWDTDSVEV